MPDSTRAALSAALSKLDPKDDTYAPVFVDLVLRAAVGAHASDVHFQPGQQGLAVAWRRQGMLEQVGVFDPVAAPRVAARLKVLAGLLTYEQSLPQEGRIQESIDGVQMRLSVFPTIMGERAVVRFFAAASSLRLLDDLGFDDTTVTLLNQAISGRHGLILICGPAGSGKTTTAYALMRELVRRYDGTVSLMSIEDPVESRLEGVAQSQVHTASGFTLEVGLRSLLRQDPEVILVGEIRDPESATLVFRAALTGHLVITTFHAGSASEAVRRLMDMGMEPYMLKSGLRAVLHQELLRALCPRCAAWHNEPICLQDSRVSRHRSAVGCAACDHIGYDGRFPLGEWLPITSLRDPTTSLDRLEARELEALATANGMVNRWTQARLAIERGRTSRDEVYRVMGWDT